MSRSDEGAGGGAVLVAFILGAVTGAAVALLWAPGTGEETRRYLGERAREGADRASEAARQVSQKVKEGAARANDAVQQGREFVTRQRETLGAAVERGREAYREAREKEQA